MKAAAFIIHLARAAQRRPQVDALLADLPLASEVLPAVDGQRLGAEERARFYSRSLHAPRYPFALSDGEIACFLSHRSAWRAIVDRGLDFGLVVEDDVSVEPLFPKVLAEVSGAAGPRDYVRFPRWERGERGEGLHRSGDISIIEPFLPALGMQVQWIGREAARLLLAATGNFDRPVDSFIQMQWLHGARVLSARPVVIREIDRELGGTVLQKKEKTILERITHEVRRPLLRAAISRRNRRWRKS